MKDCVEKKILGLKMQFNLKIYTLLKFGVSDLNEKEMSIINSLPEELLPYLPKGIEKQNEYLIMERPKDYYGEYSKTIEENGLILNESFWSHIDNIKKIFEENNLWFLDIFHNGNNLIVQKISEDEYMPIIIDFKRLGRYMYPLQFNLLLKSEQEKKFNRRFNSFKERYKG